MSSRSKVNIEGNVEIAKYMGWRFVPKTAWFNPFGYVKDVWKSPDGYVCVADRLPYGKSWKSLMDVVKRIESDGMYVVSSAGVCMVYDIRDLKKAKYHDVQYGDDRFEAIWNAIVVYIQWKVSDQKDGRKTS